jgi:hypothetical protein
MVKKFERPNKRRKKSSAEKKEGFKNSDGEMFNTAGFNGEEDVKPNGLLKPETLRSTGHERGSTTVPNTPTWPRHSTQDSGVCFPHTADSSAQPHAQHMMPYGQQYDPTAPPMNSRYSSFDENTIDGSNSSPISQYPSSATSTGSVHMMYSSSAAPVSLGYQTPMHSLPMPNNGNEMIPEMILPSQGRPQMSAVFTAVTDGEDGRWSATPASYIPQQQQTFAATSFYG